MAQLPEYELMAKMSEELDRLRQQKAQLVVMAYSEHTKQIVRQRWGLDDNDTSKDDAIDRLPPRDVFEHMCGWQFGDPSWAGTILGWLNACGYDVRERGGS